jgi:hypothetical protein
MTSIGERAAGDPWERLLEARSFMGSTPVRQAATELRAAKKRKKVADVAAVAPVRPVGGGFLGY